MYAAFFASAFQTRLAYRSQVWALLLYGLVTVFARVSVWISLYGQVGITTVGGVSQSDMITYAILAGVAFNWDYQRLIRTFGREIKSGDVSVFLLKPVHYPLMLLARELGNFAFELLTVQLPVTIIAGLVYGLTPPASLFAGIMAIVFWGLGFVILFLLSAIASILAFWLLTVFSLEWTLMALMAIFAGGTLPLWFFPAGAADIIRLLPFSFVGYQPMAVYLGKLDVAGTLSTFGVGIGWVVILTGCVVLLWSRAQNRIVVHGG